MARKKFVSMTSGSVISVGKRKKNGTWVHISKPDNNLVRTRPKRKRLTSKLSRFRD